jgi:hypothetical protein
MALSSTAVTARIHTSLSFGFPVFRRKKAAAADLPGELLFREVQLLRHTWLWPVLVVPAMLASLYIGFVMVETVFLDEKDGSLAADAAVLAICFYILKGFGVMIALMYAAKLEIEVRSAGLFVRFRPFQWKYRHFPAAELHAAEVRGTEWSWRRGWRVYGLNATAAVEVVTPKGQRVLIGTREPSKLAAALISAAA